MYFVFLVNILKCNSQILPYLSEALKLVRAYFWVSSFWGMTQLNSDFKLGLGTNLIYIYLLNNCVFNFFSWT